LAYIKLLQKASTKRDVKERVHSLTHQDHPQLKRTTTNMTLMITWSDGEEHPWFFFHEVPTKES
jgi:hypothetical protein